MNGFIRARTSIDLTVLNAVDAVLDRHDEIVLRSGQDAVDRHRVSLIADLAREPRPAVHPFEFATPKSRRKYFAMIRDGKVQTANGRYVRSGGYGDAWHVEYDVVNGMFTISIYNTFPGARYIGGSLAQDAAAAARFQVAGHRNTGWQRSSPIVWSYIDDMLSQFKVNYFEMLGDIEAQMSSGRRAYTRPTR